MSISDMTAEELRADNDARRAKGYLYNLEQSVLKKFDIENYEYQIHNWDNDIAHGGARRFELYVFCAGEQLSKYNHTWNTFKTYEDAEQAGESHRRELILEIEDRIRFLLTQTGNVKLSSIS